LTAASVILIVLGVLVSLIGVVFILAAALFGSIVDMEEFTAQFGTMSAAMGGFIATLGFLVLAYGVLHVLTGIFVLPGKSWARITGLIVASLGTLFALVGLLPGEGGYTALGLIISVGVLAGYVYAIYALATTGWWFSRPGT
jgi:hypothetical protein